MKNIVLMLIAVLYTSCEDDLPAGDCFSGENEIIAPDIGEEENYTTRDVIEVITDSRAIIVFPNATADCDNEIFLIQTETLAQNQITSRLFACNLDTSFQKAGLKIIVSGLLYENFRNENSCLQAFEVTEIREQE